MNPIYVQYTEVIPVCEFEIRRVLANEYNVNIPQVELKADDKEITAEIHIKKEVREF